MVPAWPQLAQSQLLPTFGGIALRLRHKTVLVQAFSATQKHS